MIKTVKVPIRIQEDNESIRKIKYRALDKIMSEARYLGNMAIRYAIAYNLKNIYENLEEKLSLDTRIYRILIKERTYLESGVIATLSRNFAIKLFKNSNKDAWTGKKSLPTYKSLFCPIRNTTKIKKDDQQFIISPAGFGGKWLSDDLIEKVCKQLKLENPEINRKDKKLNFISYFSWKDDGSKSIVNRIFSGEYKLCDSQFQKTKKGLMLYLSYKFEPERVLLDANKVCGVDLGYSVPAVCAVNFGPQRFFIGDGGDIWAARSKFRSQRRRQQRRLGLYSKTKKWIQSDKEINWIRTYYHALTKKIINFALQNNCGKIYIEDLSTLRKKEMEESNEYKKLIWVPSKFRELLSYKAAEAGIELVLINPRNTSRRCSKCGYISKENRKSQKDFICQQCGCKINADYNGARNIALAEGDVIKKGYEVLGGIT